MKFKDYLGKEPTANLKSRFNDVLESDKGGFIIICNMEKERISDAYQGMCKDHVMSALHTVVSDADLHGLLVDEEPAKVFKLKN